jgi:hypothetical protein
MNAFFVDLFLKAHMKLWAYPVGAVLWMVAAFFSLFVFAYGDSFHNLERKTCREGKTKKSLGPDWPYVISIFMAFGFAVKVAATLWALRGGMHFGIDVSNPSTCLLPMGLACRIPGELSICIRTFAICWYVPVALCLLSFLRRIGCFKSFAAGVRYLLTQLLAANAVYWLYGLALAIIVMPAPIGLYHVARDVYFAIKDWLLFKVVWGLVLLALGLVIIGLVGALPFMTGHWLPSRIESLLLYRNPGHHRGIGWLPIAGSAIVAAVAAVPLGWRNLWMAEADKLSFSGGPKTLWTAKVFNWSRTFELPLGTAEVYSRMHWEIPIILVIAAFIFRIRAFKGFFHAIVQFVLFTAAAYATAAFYGAFYGELFFMSLVGLMIGAGITSKSSGHTYTSDTSIDEINKDIERRKKEEEERRQREEDEYNRTHKVIDDGTFCGRKITDYGIFGWSDDDGNHYRENWDGTFTPED